MCADVDDGMILNSFNLEECPDPLTVDRVNVYDRDRIMTLREQTAWHGVCRVSPVVSALAFLLPHVLHN